MVVLVFGLRPSDVSAASSQEGPSIPLHPAFLVPAVKNSLPAELVAQQKLLEALDEKSRVAERALAKKKIAEAKVKSGGSVKTTMSVSAAPAESSPSVDLQKRREEVDANLAQYRKQLIRPKSDSPYKPLPNKGE